MTRTQYTAVIDTGDEWVAVGHFYLRDRARAYGEQQQRDGAGTLLGTARLLTKDMFRVESALLTARSRRCRAPER